jgi:hypothetical protein
MKPDDQQAEPLPAEVPEPVEYGFHKRSEQRPAHKRSGNGAAKSNGPGRRSTKRPAAEYRSLSIARCERRCPGNRRCTSSCRPNNTCTVLATKPAG